MPAKLDRCVSQLQAKGYSKDRAFAICQTSIAKAVDVGAAARSFDVRIPISKRDDEGRVYGYAYVSRGDDGELVADHSGEHVPIAELDRAAVDYMKRSRKMREQHESDVDATLIALVVHDEASKAAQGLPEDFRREGLFVGFEIADEAVRKRVRSGELKDFSIHGSALKVAVGKAGREVAVGKAQGKDGAELCILVDLEIDEISLVDRGDNPGARVALYKRRQGMKPKDKAPVGKEEHEGEDDGKDGAGGPALLALLTQLLQDEAITPEQHAALVAALAGSGGQAPAGPAPMLPEMQKAFAKQAQEIAELRKAREAADDAAAEREELAKARKLAFLPVGAEKYASVMHQIAKAYAAGQAAGAVSKAKDGEPDALAQLRAMHRAMAEAVDQSALFGEVGKRHNAPADDDVDVDDEDVPAKVRLEAAVNRAIAKAAKDGKDLDWGGGLSLVEKANPRLIQQYVMGA